MKTSNIIILSTIGFILLMNIWIIADAKSKFEKMVDQPEISELESVEIESFEHIVISDDAKIVMEFNNKSYYQLSNSQTGSLIVRNDTLYVNQDTKANIYCSNIKSITLSDNAKINIDNLKTDYLIISAFDESKLIANNSFLSKLDIYTQKEAKIIINESTIDTTNILASDYSKIGISGTLEVVRGEIKDESNLSITGANNTQFSKNGNATVKMY